MNDALCHWCILTNTALVTVGSGFKQSELQTNEQLTLHSKHSKACLSSSIQWTWRWVIASRFKRSDTLSTKRMNGLVLQWQSVSWKNGNCSDFWWIHFFLSGRSRNMWRVEKSKVVSEQTRGRVINEEGNIGSSHIQSTLWKRKYCAGLGLRAIFWNSDLSSTATLFPTREASKRKRKRDTIWLARRGGNESQHPLSLTATVTIWLLYMRKNPIQKSGHT